MKVPVPVYVVGGLIAGLVVWRMVKGPGSGAIPFLPDAIDPTSPDNVANTTFNTIYQAITGSDGSLGSDLYGALHDEHGNNVLAPVTLFARAPGSWAKDVSNSAVGIANSVSDILRNRTPSPPEINPRARH